MHNNRNADCRQRHLYRWAGGNRNQEIRPEAFRRQSPQSKTIQKGSSWLAARLKQDTQRPLEACLTYVTSCTLPGFLPGAASGELSISAMKGTAAKILVPWPGLESTENLPWTRFTRSCILTRPNPRFFFASSTSKPAPASRTTS